MNVNCKLSLTDDERNTFFRRLTGKSGKGMASRADVNVWVKDQLQSFLTLGSPSTESVMSDEEFVATCPPTPAGEEVNPEDVNVEDVMRQNKGLLRRVNILQHALDTRK